MKKIIILFAMTLVVIATYGSFTACSDAKAQNKDPYVNEIAKMLELTNAREAMKTTMTTMWTNMRLPISDKDELANAVLDEIWDDYVVECSSVYKKYFTLDEMKELNEFYESPLGQKLSDNNVNIITECSQLVSEKFSDRIQQVVSENMR